MTGEDVEVDPGRDLRPAPDPTEPRRAPDHRDGRADRPSRARWVSDLVAGRRAEHLLLLAFTLVVGVTIWRHEMWRDELQAWTLTNGSTELRDLLHDLRYEGHPALWYLLLFPITRFTDAPEAMQVVQLAVAVGTGILVVRCSPFTLLQRAGLLFGYFLVFEYGTLARSYGLGVLLAFAVCVAATRAERRWWLIGLLLALLALTSAFGAMVAVAIGGGLGVDELARRRLADPRAASLQALAVGATVAIAGVLVAYAQSIPPPDAGEYRGWRTGLDAGELASTLAAVWRAFVPIPQLQTEFWNTNLLDGRVSVAAIAAAALIVVVAWVFRGKPAAVVIWGLALGTILVFLYAKIAYASSARHYGHLLVVFVAMCWLAPSLAGREARTTRATSPRDPTEGRAALLTIVLGLQVVAGAFAVVTDWTTPFSDGRAVARHLTDTGLTDSIIIGFPDTSASTVAGYLQRDVYFPQGDRFGNYIIWDRSRVDLSRPLDDIIDDFRTTTGPRLLILRTEPLATVPDDVELLGVFDDGIVVDEHYWLYAVAPPAR